MNFPLLLADADEAIPIIAVSAAAVCGMIWSLIAGVAWVSRTRQLERTRREVAAYVAEGSMTAEEGERLLKAQPKTSA